ncbi:MerR family transcriptional regulator [Streptomyces armeniacus]|uniref:MerR family transcriptional regulator n=1 Tax=Streptomyces armeniacus TaxID=83291 RepID=A0A345XSA6_9ACTN|nr:MerR family transcriptional regulator [Streptomyces armeniacus]AXK34522.1 MerR family transcriptional regulator [Streptomyces armeniacus]
MASTALLTIGAFARASRLSPKALRLYDELGLLPPARVDPATGYRLYAPAQLERARLVAWLRRIGMPLAEIRHVCGLPGPDAAREVRAFWSRVEADTAARRDLAAFLVDQLSGKEPEMSETRTPPPEIRYAALSDAGLVRDGNQDAAYAGSRLFAVADGYGGAGAPASAAAIEVLKRELETAGPGSGSSSGPGPGSHSGPDSGSGSGLGSVPAGDLLNVLEDAVARANAAVHNAARDALPAESGTTLTAMLWTGSQLALVHIGDSRAYVLRDGGLRQITHDHTVVQARVDEGRLSPEEAASHPQRSLLARSLAGGPEVDADVRLHDVRPGDRYLLCSDGLSAVVPGGDLRDVLAAAGEPDRAVRELVAAAHRFGGPDNVSCVVADVLPRTA